MEGRVLLGWRIIGMASLCSMTDHWHNSRLTLASSLPTRSRCLEKPWFPPAKEADDLVLSSRDTREAPASRSIFQALRVAKLS